ncbi:hypothetical protein KKG48_01780 [Patescibacteria group bacterium]|nr:hypothetical protein [Patescibacteria group bacterium]MCG2694593.1 hypothetical protein [Candidatus Parcubacteria bacterium]
MATPGQMRKLIELFEKTPTQQLQDVFPFLTDLRDSNVSEIDRDEFRKICGKKKFRRVNNDDGTISFFVRVDRSLTPQQILDETGRKQYVNSDVVACMPRGKGDEVEVIFFKHGCFISDDDLEKEYERQGFVHADPYSLSAVNRGDPAFADEHSNCTHWKDSSGKWCYATFYRWDVERHVIVVRHVNAWRDGWWFAGLRIRK